MSEEEIEFNLNKFSKRPYLLRREQELTEKLTAMNRELAARLAILSELLTRAISGRRIEEKYYRKFGGEG